ncbi:nuclear transport factor 2 family protein [uncultured Enterovirga sp.]|uniref:nuclear transport factor 2 family protein n=1 Tax=uncultured Enterovirga sp. TaxID=2026352 RepID=UPI0035CC6F00
MTSLRLPQPRSIPGRRLALAASIMMATVPALASPGASDAAVTARNEGIVRDAFQRWTAGENVFPILVAPDVVWTIPGSGPVAGTYLGLQDFVEKASRPLVSRLATPLVPRVHHIWAVGERVIIRFEASATTTGGHPYRNQFVWIFRMKDGQVAEAEAFLDLVAYKEVVDKNEPRP